MITNRHKYRVYVCGVIAAALIDSFAVAANLRSPRILQEEQPSELLDLSRPFDHSSLFNNSTCAQKLIELASGEPEVRGLIVLEKGEMVAEYYTAGEDAMTRSPIWSSTKAWTNLLLGALEKDDVLSLDETVGDIFGYDPYNWIWGNVADADDRKALTIESIMTMTAGLSLPDDWLVDAAFGIFDYGTSGGEDFLDSLNYNVLDPSKTNREFEYNLVGNLLSYVIKERTRMTPEEFAVSQVFPLLGIADEDYLWHSNHDGMSYSWHGIFMTTHALAKLGMLYLQRGHANTNDAIVAEDFVLKSTQGTEMKPGYGYGLWTVPEYPERSTRYFTGGMGENGVFVDENIDRVFALRSNNYIPELAGGEVDDSLAALAEMVNDPTCSFSQPN